MSSEKELTTLIVIYDHPKVLLGMKKRGFGEGKWNGFGGKVQEGESIEAAALRELREESGSDVDGIEKRGVITFEHTDGSRPKEMHVFHAGGLLGEPSESEEMKPQWFHLDEIPFKEMWQDDLYWMPVFLQGKKFKGTFLFDDNFNLVKTDLEEVENLE
jgi:8-oxo-dGTP diphosphatase / 2-hydroxy-dATP diphosphatase